jgi:fengycin family lipopeptide synthetase D
MNSLSKKNIKDIYILSPMQEGMLFHSLLDNESSAYFEQTVLSIKGDLEIGYIEKSLNRLIERYDILRTVFIYKKVERPIQVVMKERNANIHFNDITNLPEEDKETFIENFKREDRKKGFDLAKDIPISLSVIKTGIDSYKIIWSFHHIIMDGWCLGIIIKEFLEIYQALKKNILPDLDKVYPYSDYIKWLERQDREESATYWERYLRNYEEQATLPKNSGTPINKDYELKELSFRISEDKLVELEDIVRNKNVTLNIIIQTIWGIILQRYNNTGDVVFGAVVSGRSHEVKGIENMVGLFINTIPVRIQSEGDKPFTDLLKDVQLSTLQSERYSYQPLVEIQAKTNLKQNLIGQIMVFENYPLEETVSSNSDYSLGFTVEDIEAF